MRYFNPDLGRLLRLKTWQAHYLAWHARTRHRIANPYGPAGLIRFHARLDYARRLGAVRRRLVRIKYDALRAREGGAS